MWWYFHLWCASSWATQKSDHHGDYWSNSELILEDRRISPKSIAEQLGTSRKRVGSFIHEDLTWGSSGNWVSKCLNADQKRQRFQSSEQLLEFFGRDPYCCSLCRTGAEPPPNFHRLIQQVKDRTALCWVVCCHQSDYYLTKWTPNNIIQSSNHIF